MVLVFMGNRFKSLIQKCSLQLITDDFSNYCHQRQFEFYKSRGGHLAHPFLRVMSWGVPPAAMQCDSRVGWAGPAQPS